MLTASDFGTAAPANGGATAAAEATPRVLMILSFVLERLVARNERLVNGMMDQLDEFSSSSSRTGTGCCSIHVGKSFNAFHGVRAPNISILKYLERIYKYTNCSPSCLVVGFVYIDRLVHRHPHSLVVSFNVHRLLVTSVMVASKMFDDVHYNNAFYARVGGVSNSELNRLELELLFLLDFEITVTSRVFESYCLHLEKEMLFNANLVDSDFQAAPNIQRPPLFIISNDSLDDVSEISVDDPQISSPPQLVH